MKARALCLLLLCCSATATADSRSDDPQKERARLVARSLTQEATQSFERRDYGKTQTHLEAAYMLYASEKIQYSLARVYEAQGQRLLAMRSYQQFLRKVPMSDRLPGQTEDATTAINRLQKDLGHLVFSRALLSAVRIDEEPPLPRGTIDAWVEPGTHRLVMQDDIEQLGLGAGETKTVKVSDASAESITTVDVSGQAPVANTSRTGLRAAQGTLGVLGISALAVGGALLGVDGLRRCNNFPTMCNDPLATQWPGVGLLVGGGVMFGISAALFGVDARHR